MKLNKKVLIATVCLVGAGAWGSLAHAATISVGYSTGGTVTYFNNTSSLTNVAVGTSGWSIGDLSAPSVLAPDLLDSNTISTSNTGTQSVLTLWVVETGITSPLSSSLNLLSTFTSNKLLSGWTLTEKTFYSSADNVLNSSGYSGSLLGTANFTHLNYLTGQTSLNSANLSSAYSLAEEYIISSGGGSGNTNDTIDISAVPEPSGLGILGLGLSAIGALGWIRRRQAKKAG